MEGFENLEEQLWNPFVLFGIDHHLLKVNPITIINTWIVLAVICLLVIICRYYLNKKESVIRYFTISFVNSFATLIKQTLGKLEYKHFTLVTSIFIFILLCNCISLIPWTEEPTRDFNTTFALGLVAFFYKEIYAIKTHGFISYLKEFLQPFFIMLPLNIVSHISKVISMSFRLFGNIFGGSIIQHIYGSALSNSALWQILGLATGMNLVIILFFSVFDGLIQAFVFAMLTLTYLSIAIQTEEG